MWLVLRAIVGVFADVVRLGMLFFRSSSSTRAENLVLRKQLARYIERARQASSRSHDPRKPCSVLQALGLARRGSQRRAIDHNSLAPTRVANLLAA
jgi:hypothetical protein